MSSPESFQPNIPDLISRITGGFSSERVIGAEGKAADPDGRAMDVLLQTYSFHWGERDQAVTSLMAREFAATVARHPGDEEYQRMAISRAVTLLQHMSDDDHSAFMKTVHTAVNRMFGPGVIADTLLDRICGTIADSSDTTIKILRRFGLDGHALREAWDDGRLGSSEKEKQDYRLRNVRSLLVLEAAHPGIGKALNNSLNIHHFARYPYDFLVHAYQLLDDPPSSYVLLASASLDDTQAFDRADKDRVLPGLPYEIVPIEVVEGRDVWRIRRMLARKGWGRAAHIIVDMHGNPESVAFSSSSVVTRRMLREGRLRSIGSVLRHVLQEDGTIILDSCSTGDGGSRSFAAALRTSTQRRVLAPEANTSSLVIGLEYSQGSGKPNLQVTYWEGPTAEFLPDTNGL
jgi:hypothetical protein